MRTLTSDGRVTAPRHPLVRAYLRRLDRVLDHVDRADARELWEEIVAHLSDSVTPTAGTEDVQAVLDRLGTPESLVSAGPGAPRRVPASRWLARVVRRHWILVGATVIVIAAGITCGAIADTYWHAPALTGGWMVGPLYRSDSTKSTSAGDAYAMLLRARPGERQVSKSASRTTAIAPRRSLACNIRTDSSMATTCSSLFVPARWRPVRSAGR